MKKLLGCVLSLFLLFAVVATVHAVSFSFDYAGYNWGTMEITVVADSLLVNYEASSTIPAGSQATGFAFDFDSYPTGVDNTGFISNPLTWIQLTNLNSIPNPANSSITKSAFTFGVTEGDSNNINPPGILPGEEDSFYISFGDLSGIVLDDFVNIVGVRLQSIPENINGGSLFLVGSHSVPEPATMLLLGSGLLGLVLFGRQRFK